MDYHLERKIQLSTESEYKSLYSWAIQELDEQSQQIGQNLVPWEWTLYFVASELRYNYSICLQNSTRDTESNIIESESITAILHPGFCRDGNIEDQVLYSMLGTNREIKNFHLKIYRNKEPGENEKCFMSACISSSYEIDFRQITDHDTLEVILHLSAPRFNKMVEIINTGLEQIMQLQLGQVDGFYSEWSPSIFTSYIKILTSIKEQEVINKNNCEIKPSRLGNVGEFNATFIHRCKLNSKQDLAPIHIDKLFDESLNHEEMTNQTEECNAIEKRKYSLIIEQLINNKATLDKLLIPIWLIFALLCIHLLR